MKNIHGIKRPALPPTHRSALSEADGADAVDGPVAKSSALAGEVWAHSSKRREVHRRALGTSRSIDELPGRT